MTSTEDGSGCGIGVLCQEMPVVRTRPYGPKTACNTTCVTHTPSGKSSAVISSRTVSGCQGQVGIPSSAFRWISCV